MLLLLLILPTIPTVSSNRDFHEVSYKSLGSGYSYSYLQTSTERFYKSRSLLACSAIAQNSQSEFFTYNKANQVCKNYSPKSIMKAVRMQVEDEVSYYRNSEWIKVYALSMGADSLIYNSLLNRDKPSTWNVEKCKGHYCPNFFRHPLLDIWNDLPIGEVKLVLYKNQTAVVTMVFNGRKTDIENWFSVDKLKSSPWNDLRPGETNYFSMEGFKSKRRFYVSNYHAGCDVDLGWLTINEAFDACDWEKSAIFPTILYSNINTKVKWVDGYGIADSMAIFIRLKKN